MGNTITRRREQRGWSIGKLSRKADIAELTLRNIENGTGNPTVKTLAKIAAVLGCGTSDLIDREK